MKTPAWFLPVAVLAVLWNGLGCFMVLSELTWSAEQLAQLSAAQQLAYHSRPDWLMTTSIVAVLTGLFGALLLLRQHAWAIFWLGLSLVAVIVQDIGFASIENLRQAVDSTALAVQGSVLVLAIAQVWLAKQLNYWLSLRTLQ